MIFSTTAISFILLSVGLAFCGWRFLTSYRRAYPSESKIALLLAWQFVTFVIQNGTMGFGLLVFADNPTRLSWTVLVGSVLLVAPALIGVYAAYHIFTPHRSPLLLILITILLGITLLIAGIATPPTPTLTASGSINLTMSLPIAVTTFYLILIAIGSNAYIFTRLFLTASDKSIRNFAGVIAILGWAGVINVFSQLILLYHSPAGFRYIFEIGLAIIGTVFIVILFIAPILQRWLRKR